MGIPIMGILGVGLKLVDELWDSPEEKATAKMKLLELEQNGRLAELTAEVELMKGQLEVNKKEAEHRSVFVAGWRPFIGWSCGFILLYNYILAPLLVFIFTLMGFGPEVSGLPTLQLAEIMPIIMGMLGMGYMRTREREKGVAPSEPLKK